jgi:hypothetical protein
VAFGAPLMSGGARADGPVVIVFDAPGAAIPIVCCSLGGTFPSSINSEAAIAGYYSDVNALQHSFIRSPGGRFTTFDAPGTGTLAQQGTYAYNINAAGVVAGDFYDSNNVVHGFLRLTDGTFEVFDAPGAGTAAGQGTYACTVDCLTADGRIAGDYIDANGVSHAFVRSANGAITTFDVPGAGTAINQGTYPAGLNSSGTIEGAVVDINGVYHGFVRTSDGVITTFDIPGATNTYPANINAGGTVVGFYTDAGNGFHGFVRSESGVITTFEAPNADVSAYVGTLAVCNNAADAIIGAYNDMNNLQHGYVRSPSGTFASFDASAIGNPTSPSAINGSGVITGSFTDINRGGLNRGFVRLNDE